MASSSSSSGNFCFEKFLRILQYWSIIICVLYTFAFVCVWLTEKGGMFYYEWDTKHLAPLGLEGFVGTILAHWGGPIIIVSMSSFLFVTRTPLPECTSSWASKALFEWMPWHGKVSETGERKKNQFWVGTISFNLLGFILVIIPTQGFFWSYISNYVIGMEYPLDQNLATISIFFGFMGLIALSLFLVPVSRHSVLIVAMGWSPVHAIRIHIWAGYLSFWFSIIHGITYVPIWFMHREEEGSVIRQVIPEKHCWAWNQPPPPDYRDPNYNPEEDPYHVCGHQWFNLTGIIAGVLFIVLTVSSMNYVRRRWYRNFYILHVVFGTLTMIAIVWHWSPAFLFMLPSIAYYMAGTTPILVQALASRFRGGHRIKSVRAIPSAGGVVEVTVSATKETAQMLVETTCPYVKICVPSVSLVWHPISVFAKPTSVNPSEICFIMRPVGPWSKSFASVGPVHPVPRCQNQGT